MIANIFGDWYWIVIAVVVLFGGSQLPKLARNSGEALKEFRKAHGDEPGESSQVGAGTGRSALTSPPVTAAPGYPQAPAGRVVAPAEVAPPTAEERITLSRAELDALLAAREARAKADEAKTTD